MCPYLANSDADAFCLCTPPATVAVVVYSGLAGGVLACCTLAALKQPITLLLKLQPEVLHEANPYWWIRVAITPLVLLNMTLSGVLQVGFFWFAASNHRPATAVGTSPLLHGHGLSHSPVLDLQHILSQSLLS